MKSVAKPIPFAGSQLGEIRHVCAFFNSDDEAYRVLLPFIKDGFECGDKAVHILNPDLRHDHLRRLAAAGIDPAAALRSGQLELQTNTETYLREGRFDPDRMLAAFKQLASGNAKGGFPRSRIVCQMDWAFEGRSQMDELVEFESRVNEVWRRHDDAVICVYDLAKFGGSTAIDIQRTHPMIIIGGVLHQNPFYVPPAEFLRELRQRRAGRNQSQVTRWLQEARLLGEQQRVAEELDARVAQRTSELAAANEELKQQMAERKQAEETVQESQQLLHLVLATLPVGVMVTDRAGNLVLANAASKCIWGKSVVSGSERWAQSKGFWHDSGKRIAPEEWASVRALSEGRTSLNELIDIESYDGKHKIIQNSSAPIRGAEGSIVGAVIVNEDVTQRVRAEEAHQQAGQLLRDSHSQLRALSTRLQSVREEEAARIAREIHDDLGQQLTGLKMDLVRAERMLEKLKTSPAVNALLDTIVNSTELADTIIARVQEIAANLRPAMLDKLGLSAALNFEGRRFQERTGVSCAARLPEAELNLPAEVSTTLFRIFQECLTNIARHARATRVEVELQREGGWVTLRVQDNGRGITEAAIANPESLGLLGMKERTALLGGEIAFYGGAEGGTIMNVRVPESGTLVPAKAPP